VDPWSLAEILRHFVKNVQSNSDDWLGMQHLCAANTTPHSATSYRNSRKMLTMVWTAMCMSWIRDCTIVIQPQRKCWKQRRLGVRITVTGRDMCWSFRGGGHLVLLQHESPRNSRCRIFGPSWIGPYTMKGINGTCHLIAVHANRMGPFYVWPADVAALHVDNGYNTNALRLGTSKSGDHRLKLSSRTSSIGFKFKSV
jgi:hypothetical protein